MRPPDGRQWSRDVAWGLSRAAVVAVFFSALAVLAWVLGRGRAFSGRDLAGGLGVYWATAALGGTLVGLSRPAVARRTGALAVGAAVGVLFLLAIMVWAGGPASLADGATWKACVVVGVPFGALCGWWTWRRHGPAA